MRFTQKAKEFLALLLLAACLAGCARQAEAEPEESPDQPGQQEQTQDRQPEEEPEEVLPWQTSEVAPFDPAGFTREQMLEDYDYLWDTIQENCPLLDGFARNEGQDLEEIRQNGRAKVEALADGDAAGFEQAVGYLASYFRGAGHLTPVSALAYYTVLDHDTYESETQKEVYHLPQVEAYYQWAAASPKFESQWSSRAGAGSAAPSAGQPEAIQVSQPQGVPCLQVKTFGFGDQDQAVEQIRQFCLDNLQAPHLILDIRGNSGGSTLVWEQGLEPLFAGKKLEERMVAAYRDTPLNRQMWAGWPENQPDVQTVPIDRLEELLPGADRLVWQDLAQADTAALRKTEFDYQDRQNPGGQVFEGRLWVLIDSSNYSAAEALIQRLQASDFVTLVGSASRGGGMIFAAPAKIPFALPNSGMLYQYVPFYCFNPDGSCNEFAGTAPDIDAGQRDALEVCLEQIAADKPN